MPERQKGGRRFKRSRQTIERRGYRRGRKVEGPVGKPILHGKPGLLGQVQDNMQAAIGFRHALL